MTKLKNTLKNLANLDAPAAPQVAAAEIVKQVASQEKPRPAVPVQKGADKPSRENFDPFLEAGPATTGQASEGPPPGYQYDPDEFEPQQNSIAAAVEQAASVQPTQVAAAIVQQVQSQNSPDGKRIVMASQSPNDWTLNDISPGPTRQKPQPRSRDEWVLNDISPGSTPSQEWVLEPDLPPPAAAAEIVKSIQPTTKVPEFANGSLGFRRFSSMRATGQPLLDAQTIQSTQLESSPTLGQIATALQPSSGLILGKSLPNPTGQTARSLERDTSALESDLPAAAMRVVQSVQAENLPLETALGAGESSPPVRYEGAHLGPSDSSENYNAGAGGGGGSPPPGTRTEFSIPEPDDSGRPGGPRIAGEPLKSGLWNHVANGFLTQAGDKAYSDSVIGDAFRGRKFPEIENSGFADKATFQAGRVAADIQGYGTRKGFWNMNPEDAIGTMFREIASNQGLTAPQSQLARYAAATTLGLAGGNYNPLNIAEGGRTEGFSAINPAEEDPRKSTNPIGEFAFDRAMLGRTGRVLPWEQFHEERPEVPYQTYADYQDYLRAPAFLGLVKGTMSGIDGPEARIVGSRVQPEAVLAALAAGAAVIGGFKYGSRKV